jgi:hypothetical protein
VTYLTCFLEENAVLYQNYKEKALDIDSDEEPEAKEQKAEERIVIHHKPLRSTWSQLSAVSVCILLLCLREEKASLWKPGMNVDVSFSCQ